MEFQLSINCITSTILSRQSEEQLQRSTRWNNLSVSSHRHIVSYQSTFAFALSLPPSLPPRYLNFSKKNPLLRMQFRSFFVCLFHNFTFNCHVWTASRAYKHDYYTTHILISFTRFRARIERRQQVPKISGLKTAGNRYSFPYDSQMAVNVARKKKNEFVILVTVTHAYITDGSISSE